MRIASCAIGGLFALLLAGGAEAQSVNGSTVFTANCASCHDGAATSRAPAPEQLKARTPESIIDALTGGAMRYQGLSLSGAERRAVAEFLTGRSVGGTKKVDPNVGRCVNPAAMKALSSAPLWNGWSVTPANTHFQTVKGAGFSVDDLPKLTLKWAFAFPEATSAWAQPTVAGGRLFVGGQNGVVYALDPKSGCTIWSYETKGGVRGSVNVGPRGSGYAAYFSDQKGYAYAVDAATGKELWATLVDPHPLIRLTGSPVLFENKLFVPTSSYEEVGKGPTYDCCTFRGAIVVLDAKTGKEIRRSYMIADAPKSMGKRADGGESIGPSGGAVWSAPTIDPKRRAIYVGVGNTYSGTSQPPTDGIAAFSLDDGRLLWAQQLHPGDVFGCRNDEPNCGSEQGPDYDFGASPALARTPKGKDVLIVGQKSGMGYALDPDRKGAVLWQYRAGKGGALGGIEWGVATDDRKAYFPVADGRDPGGLHAVDLDTGQRVWFAEPLKASDLLCKAGRGCTASQSAAITVIPGAVFSGSFDGGIRAYSTKDGSILWQFDTNKEFLTVNGVSGHGASLNGPAAVAVGGMLYVSSGDYRARTGNVLLAFGIE
ncbi:MAG: PQQ-binding-like beta-propeller repeat protein [Acidobacteriaceae bacterium]|jgi:polyvinyl alcohol dehydrogenase (cytochrome)|nr:PQQ-binding-like beta-propeller repeat protein [Acidobacteriaceae bacterium]